MSIDFAAQQQRQITGDFSARVAALLNEAGYTRLETDIIQPADRFLTQAGDQIITRLFTFERRGQTMALRPEFTATAAHAYARQYAGQHPLPVVRWQFHGPVFEDDPALGSVAESYSIGAELIGMAGGAADAEIALAAVRTVDLADQGKSRLVMGHVGLMRSLVEQFRLDTRTVRFLLTRLEDLADGEAGRAAVLEHLDRLLGGVTAQYSSADDTILSTFAVPERDMTWGGRTRTDVVRRLAQKRQRSAEREQIYAALDFLTAWAQIDAPAAIALDQIAALIPDQASTAWTVLADWRVLIDTLINDGLQPDRVWLHPTLERSWDYYTGLVFEVRAPDDTLLCGGGRYDDLARLLGSPVSVPAVGFACYAEAAAARMIEKGAS